MENGGKNPKLILTDKVCEGKMERHCLVGTNESWDKKAFSVQVQSKQQDVDGNP